MNKQQAQQVLLLYRPGCPAEADAQMAEALELVRRDPELQSWFDRHRAFQEAATSRFREIPVPPELRAQIRQKAVVQMPRSRSAPWWALAASIALACVLWFVWKGGDPVAVDRSADSWRSRMVRTVLRQYRMDLFDSSDPAIRRYLAEHQAPSQYTLPEKLDALPRLGAGRLSWYGEPVSMVCFDRGGGDLAFLFIAEATDLSEPPAKADPQLEKVKSLHTASWREGDLVYLLASEEEVDRYF